MAVALLHVNVPSSAGLAQSRSSRSGSPVVHGRLAFCPSGGREVTLAVSDAIRILEANTSAAEHKFWPLEHGITQILPEILERLMGHHQVQDALLLDLAIRRGGKLATFDRHIGNLLALESRHRSALEILPAE